MKIKYKSQLWMGWRKFSHLTSQNGAKIAHSWLNTPATVFCRRTVEVMKCVSFSTDMIYLFHSKWLPGLDGGQAPVYYHITDTTHIAKVPLKRLLSYTKTKMELTIYLGQKIKEYADRDGRQLVVAWGSECQATHKDVGHLRSNQEEAGTKMILHALDATASGATKLQIHSPDTDVFVLALRRYPELCENTLFLQEEGNSIG